MKAIPYTLKAYKFSLFQDISACPQNEYSSENFLCCQTEPDRFRGIHMCAKKSYGYKGTSWIAENKCHIIQRFP